MPELPPNTSNNIRESNKTEASKQRQDLDVMSDGCLLGDTAGVSVMVKEGEQSQSEM